MAKTRKADRQVAIVTLAEQTVNEVEEARRHFEFLVGNYSAPDLRAAIETICRLHFWEEALYRIDLAEEAARDLVRLLAR